MATVIDLPSLQATCTLGHRIGEMLFPGATVALIGPLGAGKTNLVRAIAEGLDVTHGEDIVLADDPGSFAKAITLFLQDENLRRRFEAAAAATAGKYDWPVITRQFVEVLKTTIQAASGPKPSPEAALHAGQR